MKEKSDTIVGKEARTDIWIDHDGRTTIRRNPFIGNESIMVLAPDEVEYLKWLLAK